MAYTRRSFSGYAVETTLAASAGATDTTLSILSSTGWPDGSTGKFYCVIDAGTSSEEKVLVTTRSSTTLQTVARGQDGTAASAHSAGASIKVMFSAVDLDEANYWVHELSAAATVAGDIPIVDEANSLTALAKGSNSRVFAVDANSALGYTTVTSAMITDGTIVNADVNSSAGIAISKLDAISTGYVVGNNSGSSAAPSAIQVSNGYTTVRKTTDESYSSNVENVDDELLFTATNGVAYLVDAQIVYSTTSGATNPGISFRFTETSGGTGSLVSTHISTVGTVTDSGLDLGVATTTAGVSTTKRSALVFGWFVGAGGTFELVWAQNSLDGSHPLTVHAGSYVRYRALT